MNRLSDPEQWQRPEYSEAFSLLDFQPERVGFNHVHEFCQRFLPPAPRTLLEVGCYPGRYMWYFSKYFGYQVKGIEYVESLAGVTTENLQRDRVRGIVVHGDFFDDDTLVKVSASDVVASFGFVEHFSDVRAVIRRHLDYAVVGGIVMIFIPNHSGVYGWIMRLVNKERYQMHNRMSFEDLVDNVPADCGEVIAGGYIGRFGLWNSWLYQWARDKGKFMYVLVRGPCWLLERVGRLLPNTKLLSPEAAIVIRRR